MSPALWLSVVFGIFIGVTCATYRNHTISHVPVIDFQDRTIWKE
jgi:hypothetical protein